MLTRDEAPPEEEAPPATEAGTIVVWCGTLGVEVSSTSSSLTPDGVLTATGVCGDGDEEIAAAVRVVVEVGELEQNSLELHQTTNPCHQHDLSARLSEVSPCVCVQIPTEKFRRVRHRDGW